jgi:cytoskeleton protein RodZ
MDLGTDLRNARERARISLPELFARTRIPIRTLRAIEENDFSAVPAGIFVRSYIRQYAREVGIDPAAAIAEYRAMTKPVEEPAGESPAAPAIEPPVEKASEPEFVPDLTESRPGWGHVLVAAALMVGLMGLNRYAASGSADASAATPATPVVASPVADTPVVAKQEAQPVATVATTGTETGIRIEMNAQGLCWVKAVADDQLAFARLMQPGETETLTAWRDITVRVGDPSSFSYSINGQPGPALGEANVPVTVRFGADGRASRVS